jgi:RNA polymerase sigma-70 factor, ECF subfamily
VTIAPRGELRLLAAAEEQQHLVDGLKARKAWAERALLEEHAAFVERVLVRILGFHPELEDLVQEVFIRALERVHDVHDASGLRSWIGAIAVFVAREAVRRRRRRRWLLVVAPEELPEPVAPSATPELRQAMRALYELLERMHPELRIVFALRVVDGMELGEVAELTDVSLSTVKRRVQRAEQWFLERARKDARLASWAGGAT